jgi:subtilisin family serine protease
MDSGVDINHPDLSGRWRGGSNSWFDPYGQHPAGPYDASGHGTWTTGVMLGGDADGTSIGMAPGAQWIAVKIFNDAGGSTASAVHAGFQWLLDPDGNPLTDDAPRVVNHSWVFGAPGCNLEFEPDLQALRAAGILPVFAAGNSGPSGGSSHSPANNPSAFAVGAVNNSGLVYGLSSRGPSDCGGASATFPDIVAPGVNIYTTDLWGFYTTASGTSLAAPHVSGGLALLLSAHPNLDAAQQEAALIQSAVDLGAAGADDTYGNGMIDLAAADQSLGPVPTVTPTGAPAGTATPFPSSTPEPTATPTAQPSPTATATLAPTATPTAAPTYTATPSPTATQSPTPTVTLLPGANLYFSTFGNATVPGVAGSADDADIYFFNSASAAFSRAIDASGPGSLLNLPAGANVDAFDRVDNTHFYLSFNAAVTLPTLGTVQDEDVLFYNAGAWSLFFDGSASGLAATDLDAISLSGGSLFFSTDNTLVPPGAGGSGDDADIYRWNGGSSFTRIIDASALGYPTANVDGLARLDATHFYLSYSADASLPGLGAAQDEDVVFFNAGTWQLAFDGTARGLTAAGLDIDAFDLP